MFWRSLPNDDVKFSCLRFWRQRELTTVNLSFSAFTWKPFVPSKRKFTSPIFFTTRPAWNNRKRLNLTQSSILVRRSRCSCRCSFLNSQIGSLRSPRQLLQWKRYFKIELCVVLNVLRSFRACHVVQNSRILLLLDRHELFSYKWRERKVYCYRLTLSSKVQIWNFQVAIWQATWKTLQQRAYRTCSTIIFLHAANHITDLWHSLCGFPQRISNSLIYKTYVIL